MSGLNLSAKSQELAQSIANVKQLEQKALGDEILVRSLSLLVAL
jgi:hypothetical protein